MKLPKTTRRYCPYCKKHTMHTISLASTTRQRGSLKRGSITRAKKRGLGRGLGNLGRWGSKPAVGKWKRKTKSTKKANIAYKCKECKKTKLQKKGKRTGRISLEKKK
jgi:large subunit ribosomal protein L44e